MKEKDLPKGTTNIWNNTFTGVQWDANAIQTVQTVAQALLNLTELFRAQNINIECMLKVNPNEQEKEVN